jgi:hypothetical protein
MLKNTMTVAVPPSSKLVSGYPAEDLRMTVPHCHSHFRSPVQSRVQMVSDGILGRVVWLPSWAVSIPSHGHTTVWWALWLAYWALWLQWLAVQLPCLAI